MAASGGQQQPWLPNLDHATSESKKEICGIDTMASLCARAIEAHDVWGRFTWAGLPSGTYLGTHAPDKTAGLLHESLSTLSASSHPVFHTLHL